MDQVQSTLCKLNDQSVLMTCDNIDAGISSSEPAAEKPSTEYDAADNDQKQNVTKNQCKKDTVDFNDQSVLTTCDDIDAEIQISEPAAEKPSTEDDAAANDQEQNVIENPCTQDTVDIIDHSVQITRDDVVTGLQAVEFGQQEDFDDECALSTSY